MCGFVGIFGTSLPRSNQLKEMTNVIAHRGPDELGFYEDDFIKLGFRRLSIIDLENGQQPLSFDQNRYTIVFNGEIYNHTEIRNRLIQKGITFNTNSDTEVIAALYSLNKEDCVKELRGMFSFIIWDKVNKELFAARDYFGIKPFFYVENKGKLYMASEAKAILAVLNNVQVNKQALQHYLTFQYTPEPETMMDRLLKLEPGHYMKKSWDGELEVRAYWQPSFTPNHETYAVQKNKVLDVLRDSVKHHMRSDVPVGSFLSGGIDSTAIVALAREINPKIKTFSVGFEIDGYSEVQVAKKSAEDLGVENINYVITAEEYLQELPRILWHMDEPVADPSAIPLYFVAKEASKHVKVVLSGEGADELFGGYNIYREPESLKLFSYIPNFGKKLLRQVALLLPEGIKGKGFLERGTTELHRRFIGNAYIMSEREKEAVLLTYQRGMESIEWVRPLYEQADTYDDVTKMQYIDLHTWLRGDILVKADKMTMAHSLELRVPFLDKNVFEIARKIQTEYKIAHQTTKFILRDALREIVPEHIFMRKKLGFPVPIRHWLKKEWYERVLNIFKNSQTDYLLNKDVLIQLLEAHKKGEGDYSRKLWTAIVFMIWHQLYIEKSDSVDEHVSEVGVQFNGKSIRTLRPNSLYLPY
ncbi:asparagine synthase (glutamine-hydrolyzing) [Bacillus sp. JCM 19034]|uniref:asparagine synthase (glutamine-hydrolyzing) n=1 Tax=Bacillus sp. JCM 19034 TaxID=1481928 RepID=UPI0009EB7B03|nr:asparagine synthase (glutamine-hydrolyzing) [Bacillus sp. JCM 19034]